MNALRTRRGIVQLRAISFAPLLSPVALAASVALAACSGSSGGDGSASSSDDASPAMSPGDDTSAVDASTGQGTSSSGAGSSSSGGTSNGAGADDGGGAGTSSGATDDASPGPSSGGPGTVTDAGGSSGGPHPDAGGTAPSTATFSAVYSGILMPICSSCHGNDAPKMSFATKASAYAALVGVTAQGSGCGKSGLTRVVAGSSATSLLFMKVSGTQTCGVRMPKNKTPLSQANITLIKNWIDQGALND